MKNKIKWTVDKLGINYDSFHTGFAIEAKLIGDLSDLDCTLPPKVKIANELQDVLDNYHQSPSITNVIFNYPATIVFLPHCEMACKKCASSLENACISQNVVVYCFMEVIGSFLSNLLGVTLF